MSDAKYGRLYTEADVRRLLDIADSTSPRALPSFEQLVSDAEPLRFPEDEPLFLLRGQDAVAPRAVDAYVRRCAGGVLTGDGSGLNHPGLAHIDGAHRAYRALRDWQTEHPDRVKVPD